MDSAGGLFFEHGKLSEAHPSTDNEELAKDLWEETLRLLSERKFQMSASSMPRLCISVLSHHHHRVAPGEARRDAAVVTQRKPVGHVRPPRPSRHWIVYYMRIYGSGTYSHPCLAGSTWRPQLTHLPFTRSVRDCRGGCASCHLAWRCCKRAVSINSYEFRGT